MPIPSKGAFILEGEWGFKRDKCEMEEEIQDQVPNAFICI